MSSSGTATGLGAMTPATRPVSSRELHVAPIAGACRGGGYLVAVFRAQLERRREPRAHQPSWRMVCVLAENRFFRRPKKAGGRSRRLLPREKFGAAKRRVVLVVCCFATGGNRAVSKLPTELLLFSLARKDNKEHANTYHGGRRAVGTAERRGGVFIINKKYILAASSHRHGSRLHAATTLPGGYIHTYMPRMRGRGDV